MIPSQEESTMKRTWILAVALVLVAAAGSAQTPAPLPGEALAAILGPAGGGACATPPDEVRLAANRPGTDPKSACSAYADCGPYGSVSCNGNNSCSAQDRNCAVPAAGKVTCDGVTTWCPGGCTNCDICDATGDCIACCQCQGYAYWICVRGIC